MANMYVRKLIGAKLRLYGLIDIPLTINIVIILRLEEWKEFS